MQGGEPMKNSEGGRARIGEGKERKERKIMGRGEAFNKSSAFVRS